MISMEDGRERTGRTRPTRAQTRQRVLDAAFHVFGSRGIASSSLDDVASAAGLTKGAVYSSFGSKDELVLTLIDEQAMDRLARALSEMDRVTGEPSEMLAAVGRVLIDAMRVDAAAHRILAEYFLLSHHDAQRRDGLRARRAHARDAVADAVRRFGDRTGLRTVFPPRETAVLLFALSNGLGVESAIDPDAVPDDLLGQVLVLLVDPNR